MEVRIHQFYVFNNAVWSKSYNVVVIVKVSSSNSRYCAVWLYDCDDKSATRDTFGARRVPFGSCVITQLSITDFLRSRLMRRVSRREDCST